MPPNYGKQYSQSFSSLFSRVAKQANVALVPFFLDGFGEDLRWFQADRIHPTEQAQPLMLENLWPALKPLLLAKRRT
jgi:acyl-CoA thioesterase I